MRDDRVRGRRVDEWLDKIEGPSHALRGIAICKRVRQAKGAKIGLRSGCFKHIACERMQEPDARRYICIEPDQDGRDYIKAVLPSLRLEFPTEQPDGQRSLFGATQ